MYCRKSKLMARFGSPGITSGLPRALADLFLEPLLFAIQHHFVEGAGKRLAAGVGAGFIGTGLDSGLRKL
jgi:hypothetical protein